MALVRAAPWADCPPGHLVELLRDGLHGSDHKAILERLSVAGLSRSCDFTVFFKMLTDNDC